MDLSSAPGTPVYALADGAVVGAGYFWHPNGNPGYGVVTTRITNPDGTLDDLYYQHIKIVNGITLCNQQGGQLYANVVGPKPTFQKIKKNQLIGYVMDMGEVEVGTNAAWSGIWGDAPHPGPWREDPEDIVRSLMAAGGGTGTLLITGIGVLDGSLGAAHQLTSSNLPGLEGPIASLNNVEQFHPLDMSHGAVQGIMSWVIGNMLPFIIRTAFVITAVVIIIALLINATSKVIESTTGETPVELGMDVAKIGAMA